jgi:hypothetical protein
VAYSSYFSGGNTTTKAPANNSGGGTGAGGKGGYTSFFGSKVRSAPDPAQLQADRAAKAQKQKQDQQAQQQKQQVQQKQQTEQKKNSSLFSQIKSGTKAFVNDAVVGTAKSAYDIASTVPKEAQVLKAKYATPNDKKAQAQATQNKKDISSNVEQAKSFLRFAPRAAVQVAESVPLLNRHPSEQNVQVTDKAPKVVKTLLGKEAIPSIQKTYKDTKQKEGTGAAVGHTAATILGDALAAKGGHDAVVKTSGKVKAAVGKDAAVNDLHQQQVAKSLFDLSQKLRTPKSVTDAAKNQAALAETTAKNTQAATKLDQKIELIEAKKADGKFTNVDKVKVQQLKAEKQQYAPVVSNTPDTHMAFGNKIEMTENNGYKPIKTADNGVVYQKVAKTGSNARGTQLSNTWYATDGSKLTQAQAEAMISGKMKTIVKAGTSPATTPKPQSPAVVVPTKAPEAIKAVSSKDSVSTKSHAQVSKDYFANKEKATADYQAHTMKEFGVDRPNIVSADSAKFIVNGGKMKPEHSVPYHEEASKFSKDYYKQLLADPATKDQPVMFTGGGSGAGKTHALVKSEGDHLNQHAAIVDTNLTDVPGSIKKIDQARTTGRPVNITYVYRDPVEAFRKGVLPRAENTGRTVPVDIHTGTHVGSLDTIQKLADHYKDDPSVNIHVIHNGPHGPEQVPLDFLKDKGYNEGELKKVLHNELTDAHAKGEISKETYHASKGSARADHAGNVEGPAKPVAKPADTASASRVYNRLKAEHPELTDDVSYEAIQLKKDAEKAVALLEKDKQQAFEVAMGQKPSSDVTSTAVNIAMAEKALSEGNHKLYAQLVTNRSLAQTRRGQELVAEKGSITDNSTSRYVKELLASRMDKLGKKYMSDLDVSMKKVSQKERATIVIDKEVAKLEKQIKSRKLDTKSALSLLREMECL